MKLGQWRSAALVGLGCAVSTLRAEQWSVAWEGTCYPETCGWERDLWGPEPIRYILDGMMTLDTRETIALWDTYKMYPSLNVEPGETLLLQFRIRISQVNGPFDPGVWLMTDNYRWISLRLAMDHVEINNFITIAEFEPGLFHVFEFRSSDMETFRFFVDEVMTYEGELLPSSYASEIGWGDIVYGASSLATWDYLRLAVVPETSTGALVGLAVALSGSRDK